MGSDPLTHFDDEGAPRMVEVGGKPETVRRAVAQARVHMAPATLARITEGRVDKGDVLAVARLAAIGGAKVASGLIPLCHPVRITGVDVQLRPDPGLPGIDVHVEVRAFDRTGPEMEALTGASVAALTIYDMCKAMDRGMVVKEVLLLSKSGGKSGDWTRSA
jgi:cyclic pyranopterin phosphate synthase